MILLAEEELKKEIEQLKHQVSQMQRPPAQASSDISRKTLATIVVLTSFIVIAIFIYSMASLNSSISRIGLTGAGNLGGVGQVIAQPQTPTTTFGTPSGPTAPTNFNPNLGNAVFLKGDKNAKVKIVEYSDFQCPFCRRFYTQTLAQLDKEYISTGKAVFYYKDFPLDSIHEGARPYALATRCAGEQGKAIEMHNKVFDEQEKQGQGTIAYVGDSTIKQWAKDIGLDSTKFNSCFDSKKYTSQIDADFQEGVSYGVSGTPTFFINGQQLVGAQPFANFKQLIDAALVG